MTRSTDEAADVRRGLALGVVGVIVFGLTLPMTRIAVLELDATFVTVGRGLVAALCAAAYIRYRGLRVPPRELWPQLVLFGLMVTLCFPLLVALAMRHAPSSHGGVVLAVQPLITALASMLVAGERPSLGFWLCSLAGTAAAVTYAVLSSAGSMALHWADLLLAGAALLGSLGYAVGGHLSRRMPGAEVISWALVMVAPLMVLVLLATGAPVLGNASSTTSWSAWMAFLYVGVFSQFLGFFAWNAGLALGGIARVGQTQLLQPFVTLLAAALLIGERVGWLEIGFGLLVVGLVAAGSRMRVAR